MILSVVIPARNEFPQIVMTCHSILNCWESDGFDYRDIEILIVNNCSNDDKYPQRGTAGTTSYLMGRGGYWNRVIRIIYDPIAGNHSARNKGAEIARGEYLFFSDAHMSYKSGFFKSMLQTVKESGGLVHGTLQFMGAYPCTTSGAGYGYTIKLGEEIKGTWNNYCINEKEWFYSAAQGHWGVMVKKNQFFDFGGYPKVHRTYGGGEFYTDMKWWMFGSCVVTDPNAVGWHLAAGRGYSYNHNDYIHNVLNIAYALGMDDWRERAYLNWLRTNNKQIMDRIMEEGEKEMVEDRAFIESRRTKTFNELLCERPWERLNKEKFNYGLPNILIYQDTWLDLIKGTPVEKLYPGKYQEGLEKFINDNLSQFVYKRK